MNTVLKPCIPKLSVGRVCLSAPRRTCTVAYSGRRAGIHLRPAYGGQAFAPYLGSLRFKHIGQNRFTNNIGTHRPKRSVKLQALLCHEALLSTQSD
jgi:hypothetical protein